MEKADQIIRLASPDLKSISFYLSQLPVYADSKYQQDEHIQGLNIPNTDVFMPIEEAKSHLKDVAFTLPYSDEIYEPSKDKRFNKRMKEIAEKVVTYENE